MSVKFKIGFEVDAQTMFGIMAKFLPFENLHVEEIVERPKPIALPKLKLVKPNGAKAKPNGEKTFKRRFRAIDLKTGINAIILDALADGKPHTPTELRDAINATGKFSPNSLGSRMVQLIRDGHVAKHADGQYVLGKAP